MIKEIIQYNDLIAQLVSKDLKLKYRRSFLGYVWSILNPLAIMLVMVVVFSKMFRWDIPNYPVYLIIGQTLFNYMSNTTTQSIYSIIDNGSLIRKVYVPKYIFTLAKVTSGLVDFLFSLGAMIVVMLFTGCEFSLYMLLLPWVALQLYVFCLGLGFILAAASVFFRDIRYIYNVVLTAWMYLTPVFYPITMLPDNVKWLVAHFNPMHIYIHQFRDLALYQQLPAIKLIIAGWAAALLAFFAGRLIFKKTEGKFILYI